MTRWTEKCRGLLPWRLSFMRLEWPNPETFETRLQDERYLCPREGGRVWYIAPWSYSSYGCLLNNICALLDLLRQYCEQRSRIWGIFQGLESVGRITDSLLPIVLLFTFPSQADWSIGQVVNNPGGDGRVNSPHPWLSSSPWLEDAECSREIEEGAAAPAAAGGSPGGTIEGLQDLYHLWCQRNWFIVFEVSSGCLLWHMKQAEHLPQRRSCFRFGLKRLFQDRGQLVSTPPPPISLGLVPLGAGALTWWSVSSCLLTWRVVMGGAISRWGFRVWRDPCGG